MAGFKTVGACLAAAALCRCGGSPAQDPPYRFDAQQMRGAIVVETIQGTLLEKAKKGPPLFPVPMYIDTITRTCKMEHADPTNYETFMIHDPRCGYVPSNLWAEFAYFCTEHRMWYYRYISADKKSDVMMGPFFVDRAPVFGGPEHRRGGPNTGN